ncbi:MAG: hypothetical protein C4524_11040 [Candidatus Zixiibacteriota bacterium]|nr:MAG: hypothetical protein C4524_11040 [candidate division Zixibacteria bacterium]
MRVSMPAYLLLLAALLFTAGCDDDDDDNGNGPGGVEQQPPVIANLLAMPDSIGPGGSTQLLVVAYDLNGDSLSYQWSVPTGELSDETSASPVWTVFQADSAGVYTATVDVTAGGETTTGMVSVGILMDLPEGAFYLGNNEMVCQHCHSDYIAAWSLTAHAEAYKSSDEECNRCHSTGWNDTLNNAGYDELMIEALRDVQCEACHGPLGPDPTMHEPEIQGLLSGETCGNCHHDSTAEPIAASPTWEEWAMSDHGTVINDTFTVEEFIEEWGTFGDCDHCHIGEGFLFVWDEDWAFDPSAGYYEEFGAHMISCGICHDPHPTHGSLTGTEPLNLRATVPIELPNPTGYMITGWGQSLLCGNCHRDRRTPQYISNAIQNGSPRPAPHPSAESNMVHGIGSIAPGADTTLGYATSNTVPVPHQHANVGAIGQDPCTECHMIIVEGSPHDPQTGHTFMPEVSFCQNCHATDEDFDVGGVKDSVEMLMEDLENLILANNPDLNAAGWSEANVGDTTLTTPEARVAAWAWFFVEQDGTFGIHNRDYTYQILNQSLTWYDSVVTVSQPKRGWTWTWK